MTDKVKGKKIGYMCTLVQRVSSLDQQANSSLRAQKEILLK